jgi:hypothetical protein
MAAWARDEHGLALDLYARAALCAYQFQVYVGDPGISPVDEYTQAFMTEMHERAAERLTAMHEAGEDQAVRDACARIRQFFDPYWRTANTQAPLDTLAELLTAGRAGEVVGRIFPPPPGHADLHQPLSLYRGTADVALYEMESQLNQPPGTPLAPLV